MVLVIDSNESHASRMTAVLRDAGYGVQPTAHEGALQHLHEGHPFGAVIVCVAAEPSTLSSQDRLGEFVLRYMTHVVPALLSRTIVLTSLPSDSLAFTGTNSVLAEPIDEQALLRILALLMRS